MTKCLAALAAAFLWCLLYVPAAANGVVQSKSTSASSGNGALTLTSAPTSGNLIVECAGANHDIFASLNTTSWTSIAHGGSGNGFVACAYRYVLPGDTAALPNMATATLGFQAIEAVELSGVSGVIAVDLEGTDAKYNQGTSTVTLGSLTTGHNADLALIVAFNYDGGGNLSISAPWVPVELNNNFGNYGSWALWQQSFATSGTSVTATMTPNTTSNPFGYIAMVFNGIAPIVTTEQSSKMNAYPVLQSGGAAIQNASKINGYVVLQYSTSMSKTNAYVVLTSKPNNGLMFHVFP